MPLPLRPDKDETKNSLVLPDLTSSTTSGKTDKEASAGVTEDVNEWDDAANPFISEDTEDIAANKEEISLPDLSAVAASENSPEVTPTPASAEPDSSLSTEEINLDQIFGDIAGDTLVQDFLADPKGAELISETPSAATTTHDGLPSLDQFGENIDDFLNSLDSDTTIEKEAESLSPLIPEELPQTPPEIGKIETSESTTLNEPAIKTTNDEFDDFFASIATETLNSPEATEGTEGSDKPKNQITVAESSPEPDTTPAATPLALPDITAPVPVVSPEPETHDDFDDFFKGIAAENLESSEIANPTVETANPLGPPATPRESEPDHEDDFSFLNDIPEIAEEGKTDEKIPDAEIKNDDGPVENNGEKDPAPTSEDIPENPDSDKEQKPTDLNDQLDAFEDELKDAPEPLRKGKSKASKSQKKSNPVVVFVRKFLQGLTKIPFVGILFRPLVAISGFVTIVILILPLLLIPLILFLIAGAGLSSEGTAKGPDESSVTLTEFTYSNGTAHALLTNTGDVIAKVTVSFDLMRYEASLDPSKWVSYQKVSTCNTKEIDVEIDGKKTVSLKCPIDSTGISTKIVGSVTF